MSGYVPPSFVPSVHESPSPRENEGVVAYLQMPTNAQNSSNASEELVKASTRHVQPAATEVDLAKRAMGTACTDMVIQALTEPLPEGWTACRTKDGEVYYHCISKSVSQWSHPTKPWADGRDANQELSERRILQALLGDSECFRGTKTRRKSPSCEQQPPLAHSVYDARSRHVNLPIPETILRNSVAAVKREDLQVRAFALHGLLSKEEAVSFSTAAEAAGFRSSDVKREFPDELRNNARLIHFNDALAMTLWQRLASCLAHRDIYLLQPMGFAAEGRWKPVGVNQCFRISRYNEGEHFATHCDGMYANEDGHCSIYSIVLYLNDDFEGGELELPGEQLFRPRAGSAVLFPHDMLHAGRSVSKGTKYVVRSELMFKCVAASRLPCSPEFIHDPLFQKMASLYEQIGDLALSGNPEATTKAYQEALGIQISHQGTLSKASTLKRSQLSLGFMHPDSRFFSIQSLAQALSFLAPFEVLLVKSVSYAWRDASELGILWRSFFSVRWPGSAQVVEDETQALDPEMKDWHGLYRQNYIREVRSPRCIIFLDSMINMQSEGKKPLAPVRAVAYHNETGVGWDQTLKLRRGWYVGRDYARQSWHDEGEINWDLLPEIFAYAFKELEINPSENIVIVPVLPGVFTKHEQERLVRILSCRYEVPKVYLPPAPLCALLAHNLSTGVVIWSRTIGESCICCYHNEIQVAFSPAFKLDMNALDELATQLANVTAQLDDDMASQVLRHIVYSPPPKEYTIGNRSRRQRDEDDAAKVKADQIDFKEVQRLLQQRILSSSQVLEPKVNDVLRGANTLAASLERLKRFEAVQDEVAHWEWRIFIGGSWCRLPTHVAGVLEGAIQSGTPYARVMLYWNSSYLMADLETFSIALEESFRSYERRPKSQSLKLTRYLRGYPSSQPDTRKTTEVTKKDVREVEKIQGMDAIHVSTLTGKLVFSMAKAMASGLVAKDMC